MVHRVLEGFVHSSWWKGQISNATNVTNGLLSVSIASNLNGLPKENVILTIKMQVVLVVELLNLALPKCSRTAFFLTATSYVNYDNHSATYFLVFIYSCSESISQFYI